MIVSYSEISRWDTCKRAYYYNFMLSKKPIEESDAISTGRKGHKLLQAFYTALQEGKTKEEALALTDISAKKIMTGFRGSVDGSLLLAWTLVGNYIRETDFTSETLLVENRFLLPVSAIAPKAANLEGVQIGFTPDVVFKRNGGFCDVEDAKFVGRAWSQKKINRFVQAKLYHIFLRAMGYKVSRSGVRFFNTTTGKITLFSEPLEKDEADTLISDFVSSVAEVVEYRTNDTIDYSKTRRVMNNTACQFCSFEIPCTLQAKGKSAEKTLETEYMDNDYDYSK